MENEFSPLNENEVIFVRSGRVLMPNPTFRVVEFLDALAQAVSDREEEWTEDAEGWFTDGVDCEVLRFNNQGWQRGKVRIRVEFCPAKQPKLLREDASPRRPNRETPYRRSEPRRTEAFLEDDIDADYIDY